MIDLKGARVLVTGGTGFIGHAIAQALSAAGAHTTITSRSHSEENSIAGDLTDFNFCNKACENQDYVIHAACLRGNHQYRSTQGKHIITNNVIATLNMLQAAKEAKVQKFLFISSILVDYPTEESAKNPYTWAKITEEKMVADFDAVLPTVTVRVQNVYGPNDRNDANRSHAVASLIKKIPEKSGTLTLPASSADKRPYVYVEDVANGVLTALQTYDKKEPVYLGDFEMVDVVTIAKKIAEKLNPDLIIETEHTDEPAAQYDFSHANMLPGFKTTTSFEKGIEKTLANLS